MINQFAGMLNGPIGAFQGITIDPAIYNATPQQKADYYNQLIAQGNTDADIRAAFGGISANDPNWVYLLQLAGASTLSAQKAQDIGDFTGWVQDPTNVSMFLDQAGDNLTAATDLLRNWIDARLTANNVTDADVKTVTDMTMAQLYQRATNALVQAYNALPTTTMPIVPGLPNPIPAHVESMPVVQETQLPTQVQNAATTAAVESMATKTPQQKAAYYNSLLTAGFTDQEIRAMYGVADANNADWVYLRQLAASLKNTAVATAHNAGAAGLLTPQNLAIGALLAILVLRR